MQPGKHHTTLRILGELSRILLALLFLFSGFVKAVDPLGTALKMESYFVGLGMEFLAPTSLVAACGLIIFEMMLGVALLMGLWRRIVAWATLLLMSGMTLLTLYIALYDPVDDCGCFGDFLKVSNSATFIKNLFFMIPTALLFYTRGYTYRPHFPTRATSYSLFLLALFGVCFFIQQNVRHLPLFDFRPFKVGTNLVELVSTPPDAPQDEYSYRIIYEKEGKEKAFPLDSLPDESWQYVETQEILVAEGYRPAVEDFAILRGYDDVTEQLLSETKHQAIWITAQHWEEASKSVKGALQELQHYAKEHAIPLYGLSGSDSQATAQWQLETEAEYPCLLVDATTIKTMARANPAIFFLEKETIKSKINARDLKEGEVATQVDAIFASSSPSGEPWLPRLLPLVLWALISLVALASSLFKRT